MDLLLDEVTNEGEVESEETVFYLKKSAMPFRIGYKVYVKDGSSVYHVSKDLAGIYTTILVNGEERLNAKRKPISCIPEYSFIKDGEVVGTLKKRFSVAKPEFYGKIYERNIQMYGNLWREGFDIFLDGKHAGIVDSVRMPWADCYRIRIYEKEYIDAMVMFGVLCEGLMHQGVTE